MDDPRRVSERLRDTDEPMALLEGLVGHLPVAVQVFRLDGSCVLVNRAFRALFGAEPDPELNLLSTSGGAAIGEDEAGFAAPFRRAAADETVSLPGRWYEPVELRQLGIGTGGRLALEATLFPVLDAQGTSRHVGICFRDVSATLERDTVVAGREDAREALRANEARDITELEKVQAQLLISDRMASVGTIAAGVAHELNNPLASVIANLDLVTRDLAGTALRAGGVADLGEILEELRDASDAAARMREIVRDLKLFSRSSPDEERRSIDVNGALEAVARMALNEIRHRARLVKDLHEVPRVNANEARLGQVLLNLIVNAAHAIPEGNAEHHELRLATRVDELGRVVVEVGDTGSGMSPELQARLFTPFFTTKPVGVGSGLGLSICHRIVSELGGEIQVTSQLGKGSIFRIFLPAEAKVVAVAAAPSAPAATAQAPRGRVLVVDDEPMISAVMRRTLAGEHDVTVCNSATDALARIVAGARYDVILCDLMMPQMTGMDLHAELARVAPEQVQRMIFVTGGAFTPRAREFLDGTSCERLEKPFNPHGLRALVGERVRRRS